MLVVVPAIVSDSDLNPERKSRRADGGIAVSTATFEDLAVVLPTQVQVRSGSDGGRAHHNFRLESTIY